MFLVFAFAGCIVQVLEGVATEAMGEDEEEGVEGDTTTTTGGHNENQMWYLLFIVFVTYSMLPLPLLWGILAGSFTALAHLILTLVIYEVRK